MLNQYNLCMDTLRIIRKAQGLNQEQLAEKAGVEQSTISKIENGWDGVTLRNLRLIAKALDIPAYQLLTEDDAAAELILLRGYRSLSDERKKGWKDMALAAKAGDPQENQ